jgi:hypothetical protein
VTAKDLAGLPIDNLEMTESQLEILMQASKSHSKVPVQRDGEEIQYTEEGR